MSKVLVLGATGNLGPFVVRGLLDNGHSVTALQRTGSTSTPPHGISSATADYESQDALVSAFSGYDVVICTIGGDALAPSFVAKQKIIIDAAIAAGVKRFIPSEFGSDCATKRSEEVALYHPKQAVHKYLESKASEGKIEYTTIMNAPFAEWMFGLPLLGGFHIKERKVDLFDDSSLPFPTTNLATIGNAVGVALKKWDETRNRIILIRGAYFSQDEALEIFEELTGGSKWEVTRFKTTDELEGGLAAIKVDPHDFPGGIARALRGVVYSRHYNERYDDEDAIRKQNDLLEVKAWNKDDLRDFIKGIVDQQA